MGLKAWAELRYAIATGKFEGVKSYIDEAVSSGSPIGQYAGVYLGMWAKGAPMAHRYDFGTSLTMLRGSAESGFLPAILELEEAHIEGSIWSRTTPHDFPLDRAKAYQLFSEGARQGDARSYKWLGILNYRGWGTDKDLDSAQLNFAEALVRGDEGAAGWLTQVQEERTRLIGERPLAFSILNGGERKAMQLFAEGDFEGLDAIYLNEAIFAKRIGAINFLAVYTQSQARAFRKTCPERIAGKNIEWATENKETFVGGVLSGITTGRSTTNSNSIYVEYAPEFEYAIMNSSPFVLGVYRSDIAAFIAHETGCDDKRIRNMEENMKAYMKLP